MVMRDCVHTVAIAARLYYKAKMTCPRTPMMLHMLERALVACHGDMVSAARECGTHAVYVRQWLTADANAGARLREAQIAGWQALESVAYKRAVKGTKKGVWYQGERVGYEREYSDKLLMDMMKARIPAYSAEPTTTTMSVNVAIMPRADNYQDWMVQRDSTLSARSLTNTINGIPSPVQPQPYLPEPERPQPVIPSLAELSENDNCLPDI
jgi:hypothetical protein